MPIAILLCVLAPDAWAQDKPMDRPDRGPRVGADAPNFRALRMGEKGEVDLHDVIAREKKPVVLIFGSIS